MIRRALSCLFSTEVTVKTLQKQIALPANKFYQLAARLLQETLLLWEMIHNNIIPGDHDFLHQSGIRLISFQKQWTLQEVASMLKIMHSYKVYNAVLVKHIENQLYLRYEETILTALIRIRQAKADRKKQLLQELEQSSKDMFKILNETPQQNSAADTNFKKSNETTELLLQDLNLDFPLPLMSQICIYLCELGVTESKLVTLLTDFLKQTDSLKENPSHILACVRVANHLCVSAHHEYISNSKQYTRKSLKKINKFQSTNFQQILPAALQSSSKFTFEDFKRFFQYMSVFPVKKSKFKRAAMNLFEQELPRLVLAGAGGPELAKCFGNLSEITKSDPRLIQNFRRTFQQYRQYLPANIDKDMQNGQTAKPKQENQEDSQSNDQPVAENKHSATFL